MTDRHLNLFYSYNQDNELIEDNLTRAFITTLDLLTGESKDRLLSNLFQEHSQSDPSVELPESFDAAQFALQGYMDRKSLPRYKMRYVVSLTSRRYPLQTASFEKPSSPPVDTDTRPTSRPDAWIYHPPGEYCFVVEVKAGDGVLHWGQVGAHAEEWMRISWDQVRKHYITLSWYDVLDVLDELLGKMANEQEERLLEMLRQFMGFYGYRLFSGITFEPLKSVPEYTIPFEGITISDHYDSLHSFNGFAFDILTEPPEFRLRNNAA